MRTRVLIEALAGGRLRHTATGALAVRQTGPDTLHLVGTAAGPMADDRVLIEIDLGPGARLRVRSVAASVVLAGESQVRWALRAGAGARLDVAPEPTVVTAGAAHRSRADVVLAADAELVLVERVQLGRSREAPGRWSSTLTVDRDGRPLLRHELELGPGSPLHERLGPSDARAVTSVLRVPDARAPAVTGDQVRMPLAGGGSLTSELAPCL